MSSGLALEDRHGEGANVERDGLLFGDDYSVSTLNNYFNQDIQVAGRVLTRVT